MINGKPQASYTDDRGRRRLYPNSPAPARPKQTPVSVSEGSPTLKALSRRELERLDTALARMQLGFPMEDPATMKGPVRKPITIRELIRDEQGNAVKSIEYQQPGGQWPEIAHPVPTPPVVITRQINGSQVTWSYRIGEHVVAQGQCRLGDKTDQKLVRGERET